jgi:hypothetical protein
LKIQIFLSEPAIKYDPFQQTLPPKATNFAEKMFVTLLFWCITFKSVPARLHITADTRQLYGLMEIILPTSFNLLLDTGMLHDEINNLNYSIIQLQKNTTHSGLEMSK